MTDPVRAAFDALQAHLDPAVLVVTVAAGDERDGCLVGFATQCSIDPTRFLVCLSVRNRTTRLAAEATTLAVHGLRRDQRDLAELFGGSTGDEVDKLSQVDWRPWTDGTPLLEDARRWFVGRTLDRVRFGDHTGYVLDPVDAGPLDAGPVSPTMRLGDVRDVEPGHAP